MARAFGRWLEERGLYWRPPDRRTRREVEDEIAAELEFHVAARAADLERDGLSADAARREAERRFGDRARIERACRQAQIGERLMLQRIQAVLLIVLLGVVGWLGWSSFESQRRSETQLAALSEQLAAMKTVIERSDAQRLAAAPLLYGAPLPPGVALSSAPIRTADPAAAPPEAVANAPSIDQLLARLAADPRGWQVGFDVGVDLAQLDPEAGWRTFQALWPKVVQIEARRQLLKGFFFEHVAARIHPHVLDVLDLAARDGDVTVQNGAFDYLRAFAFCDFSTDTPAYLAWREQTRERPLNDVLLDGARGFAVRLIAVRDGAAAVQLNEEANNWWMNLDRADGPDLRGALIGAGVIAAATRWLDQPDQQLREQAIRFLAFLQVDFATVATWLQGDAIHAWAAQKVLDSSRYVLEVGDVVRLFDAEDYTLRQLALEKCWRLDLNQEPELQRRLLALVAAHAELDAATAGALFRALRKPDCRFAVEPLLALLDITPPTAESQGWMNELVGALGQIGDPRAIPPLIALRLALTERSDQSLLVANGLEPLTGVEDWSRGADFWKNWWTTNRARFGAELASAEIPELAWQRVQRGEK